MTDFSDDFLAILGEWQNGWGDNWDRKQDITKRLETVLDDLNLPAAAKKVSARCYRKRFLWPENSRKGGGDMLPLFWDGVVEEGVASWSTDLNFLIEGNFKRSCVLARSRLFFGPSPLRMKSS